MAVDTRPTPRSSLLTPLKIEPTARSRPLLVRPGAQYDCFGDGTCCTDIHALGPVTRVEQRAVELLEPGSLIRHKDLLAPVFRHQEHGPCVLRSSRGCELHARHGAASKPIGCSRFPFGLIATPEGGRITTEHRCPCRTMGERPPLTVEASEPWIRDSSGRLSPNGRVGPKLRLSPGKLVTFSRFRLIEEPMLAALLAGEAPLTVLGVKPLGRLRGESFRKVATDMLSERDGSAYGEAMVWFGNALTALLNDQPLALGQRPWGESFDKSEARSLNKQKPGALLNDWLADLLWSLDWVFSTSSFEAGKREMASLFVVAQVIMRRLVRARVRPDRAAAEAIMMVEVGRQSGEWERVQGAL